MVRVTLRGRRYLTAFLLTTFIFIIGVFVGLYFNQERIDYVKGVSNDQNLDYESMQLQYAYIDYIGKESCVLLSKTLETNLLSLEDLRVKIEKYSKDFNLDDDKYVELKRQYTLAELKYWLLSKKAKGICGDDIVSLIYFYSTKDDCNDCRAQSYVLTSLKEEFGMELLVFSVDEHFEEEPMVGVLKEVYDINRYPALIIEDKALEGLIEKEDLKKVICLKLKDSELCD